MPIDKYPAWAEPSTVNHVETDLDNLIVQYAQAHSIRLKPRELTAIATRILPAVYATVEAQVEAAVNRRAYA